MEISQGSTDQSADSVQIVKKEVALPELDASAKSSSIDRWKPPSLPTHTSNRHGPTAASCQALADFTKG